MKKHRHSPISPNAIAWTLSVGLIAIVVALVVSPRSSITSPGPKPLESKGSEVFSFEENRSVIEGKVKKETSVTQYGNSEGGIDTGTKIHYVLQLDQDITVIASADDRSNETTHASEVHIFAENIRLDDYVDKNIKIRGTFMSRHTWHHKRPLLFLIDTVVPFSENGDEQR